MINFGLIESGLFVGSAPQSRVDIDRLKKMRVTAVVSLQSDEDFRAYRIDWKKLLGIYQKHDIVVQRFPVIDFNETDLGNKIAQPAKALHQLLQVGHNVYVHCNAGICRAPGAVLTYLCVYRGMSIEQGLTMIRLARPQANPYLRAVEKGIAELTAH